MSVLFIVLTWLACTSLGAAFLVNRKDWFSGLVLWGIASWMLLQLP